MSDGFCDISFEGDYGEENEFYAERTVKARRPHTCVECHRRIEPGSDYVRVVGKSDGRIWMVKLCAACDEILKEFSQGAWAFGELWENFRGTWKGGVPLQPCLNRVHSVAAKRQMVEQWQAAKGVR